MKETLFIYSSTKTDGTKIVYKCLINEMTLENIRLKKMELL